MGLFGILAAIVAVATSAASYIAQRQQAKKAKEAAEDAAAVQVSGHNSNRSLYAVYGKALVGSTTIWKKVTKHKAATNPPTGFKRLSSDFSAATSTGENDDYRWFYRAVAICSGPIEDITNVLIDNQSYQDDRFKVDSSDHFATNVSYGTDAGAYFSRLTEKSASEFREWDSTKLGKGVVHAVERMFLNKKHPAFAGEPTTKYEIKGRLVYDPRLDSTIPGGSGTHLYTDPGTWAWSDNPALCLLDFLTNDEFGRGLSHTDIDLSSFQTAATKCDELVTIPVPLTNTTGSAVVIYNPYLGSIENIANSARYTQYRPDQGDAETTQKRFRCNVALDCDKPVKDNMQVLLNCFRAYLVNVNGELQVHMEDVASSVMSITDDDIIGGLQVSSGDRSARINRATVKFLNENRMHQPDQASWPAITSSQYTTYLNEDQGEALHQQFTIKGVTDYYQAEDIAEYIVRDSRATLTARGTFHPRCMFLVPGDVIDLTYDSASWVSKFFKVTAVNVDLMSLETSLELREYDSSVYTWNASKGNEPLGFSWTNPNVNGALTAPTISSITSAVQTNTDGSTNLVMTVNSSGIPHAATVAEVLYTINGTDDWQSMLIPNPNGTQSSVDILVAADNTLYDVRLRYRAQLADGRLMASAEATSSHTTVTLTGTHLGSIETGATDGADVGTNLRDSEGNIISDSVITNFDDATALGFNPAFSTWTGTYPEGWKNWASTPPTKVTSSPTPLTGSNAAQWAVTTAVNHGMQAISSDTATFRFPLNSVVIGSYDVYIASSPAPTGTGCGLLVRLNDSGSANYAEKWARPDMSVTGQWQRVYFKVSQDDRDNSSALTGPNYATIQLFMLASWDGYSQTRFQGTITFDNLRLAVVDPNLERSTLGFNVYDESGNLISDVDIRNDQIVASQMGFINTNPTFEIFREDADGNKFPAGWYHRHTSRAVYTNLTDRDIRIINTDCRIVGDAFAVNPDTVYDVVFMARSSGTPTSTFDVVMSEYNSELPTGKRAVGFNDTGSESAFIQDRTTFLNLTPSRLNMTLTGGFTVYRSTYTPSAAAKYASLEIGGEANAEIEWCGIVEKSTRNTGALADKDTVNTTEIIQGAVGQTVHSSAAGTTIVSTTYTTVITSGTMTLSGGKAIIVCSIECGTNGAPGASTNDDGAVRLKLQTNTDGAGWVDRDTTIVGARNDGSSDVNWYIPWVVQLGVTGISSTIQARVQAQQFDIGNGNKNTDLSSIKITMFGAKR